MNSLASILYSSSSAATKKKRKNLSLQPTLKSLPTKKSTHCQFGMLLRSSTPKSLQTRIQTTIKAHPTTLSSPSSTSSMSLSINSSASPRCSTPLFSKQRRTRPFIVCELCRQRAFQSPNANQNDNPMRKEQDKPSAHHHHSASLHYYQYQMSKSIRCRQRRTTLDQLLVWIV